MPLQNQFRNLVSILNFLDKMNGSADILNNNQLIGGYFDDPNHYAPIYNDFNKEDEFLNSSEDDNHISSSNFFANPNGNGLFNTHNGYSGNNDDINNSDVLQGNKKIEIQQNKTSTNYISTINGKQINTSNKMMDKTFTELFGSPEGNNQTLLTFQMTKTKNKRRTKEEIERDKNSSVIKKPNVMKKRGRQKKGDRNGDSKHSRCADDNASKRINTAYFRNLRNWLNRSFIDENLNFMNEEENKLTKKNYFLKLNPIINNKIKKDIRIEIMEKKLKDLFSDYDLSIKYKNPIKNHNKNLITKIYDEQNQPFVKFILELSYLEGLKYFSGQITDEEMIEKFKANYICTYDEQLIRKFIGNFEKIDIFLKTLYNKLIKELSGEEIKDYFSKIKYLCLNYKESFVDKKKRGPNKNKKTAEDKKKDNSK